MSTNSTNFKEALIIAVVGAVVGSLITGVVSLIIFFSGDYKTQEDISKELQPIIVTIDDGDVDNMDIDTSVKFISEEIAKLKEENAELKEENAKLKEENTDSQQKIGEYELSPQVEIIDATFVNEGSEMNEISEGSVIKYGDMRYYSERITNVISGGELKYYPDVKKVIYGEITAGAETTEVDLLDVWDIVFDGSYKLYTSSSSETFKLGNTVYNEGFTLQTARYGANVVNIKFALNNQYSKLTFDVGRVSGTNAVDTTLEVFIDNEFVKTYTLSADEISQKITIDLNYARELRLVMKNGNDSLYGFVNSSLEK